MDVSDCVFDISIVFIEWYRKWIDDLNCLASIVLVSDWIHMHSFTLSTAQLILVVNLLVAMWCFTTMIFSSFIIIDLKNILKAIST